MISSELALFSFSASKSTRRRRSSAAFVLAICVATNLSGCSKVNMQDVTGSIGGRPTTMPTSDPELRAYAETWGKRYDSDPTNKTVVLTYAHALRALDRNDQAVAVMEGLAVKQPNDREVLAAYGKALADAGRLQQAAQVLSNAQLPERPNWSVLSAQGSVADRLGAHAQAQDYYLAALRIQPNDPSVLSNLGLSYALSRDLPRAESTLQSAASQPGADMRVRQNLALVLALEGKFSEAEDWSRRDLSPIDAAANVATIRRMIAQSNTWRDIQKADRPKRKDKTSEPSDS